MNSRAIPDMAKTVRERTVRAFLGPAALAAYLLLGALAIWSVAVLSRLSLLEHEGEISRQFVQAMLDATESAEYFDHGGVDGNRDLQRFMERLLQMPAIVQANIFAPDGSVLWSSTKALIGTRYDDNPEFERARRGGVAVERDAAPSGGDDEAKTEHRFLPGGTGEFVEIYMPVYNKDRSRQVGVVEIYRDGSTLREALERSQTWLVVTLVVVGVGMFAVAGLSLRRAGRVIAHQQELLVRDAGLVAVGAAGGAIAHNIRNPLANIRSTAELLFEDCPDQHRHSLEGIVEEVDRINSWIVGMLEYIRVAGPVRDVDLTSCLREALRMVASQAREQGVRVNLHTERGLAPVRGEPHVIEHVFLTILSNALDAMPDGGEIDIVESTDGAMVTVEISDTGPGIDEEVVRNIGRFIGTAQPGRMGVGLGLAKRILEVFEGEIAFHSEPGRGTRVRLAFRPGGDGR